MHSSDCGDFLWGFATSAPQIEGAWDADGKAPSIWDEFSARRWRVRGGDTPAVACDHYSRYVEDLDLMRSLNARAYRFSLAWARLLPAGRPAASTNASAGTNANASAGTSAGTSASAGMNASARRGRFGANPGGVDFYDRLIDGLLERGIRPFVTLYHWDLPLALEKKGGWTNRDIIDWFTEYAGTCARLYGDRVNDWIVLNEPFVFTFVGYLVGYHAPGRFGMRNFLAATHHALLAQGQAARALASENGAFRLGTTISTCPGHPYSPTPGDRAAANRFNALLNRLHVDPVFGQGYPLAELPFLKKMDRFIKDGDMENIKFPFHFLGMNNYTREIVKSCRPVPYFHCRIVRPNVPRTAMGWEVYPEGIYEMLKFYGAYPEIPEIIVTENGAAFPDTLQDGRVQDPDRIDFYKRYLAAVLKAKEEGVNVTGYFAWSLLDNFEWAEGYGKRFGLVHVDFATGKRTIKESGLWYRDFIGER